VPYRFYPSEARKLAEKIIAEELTGKEYDEDDAKELSLTICERIKNGVKSKSPTQYLTVSSADRPHSISVTCVLTDAQSVMVPTLIDCCLCCVCAQH
jgi:hypothetical protein